MIYEFKIRDVAPFINWLYFFHAWGFQPRYSQIAQIHSCASCLNAWLATFPEAEKAKAKEASLLFNEATRMLNTMDAQQLTVKSIVRLCAANSDGDDIIIEGTRFPLLRQQHRTDNNTPFLCLSDFIRPLTQGIPDKIGLFATSIPNDFEKTCSDDQYQTLLIQTLNDRLAEAATEKMHLLVRKELWGYAPNENLSISELHRECFQGIRPAIGYPSLPDQSVNFILDSLLDMGKIGITITEHGAMYPHSSVSGLMIAHPQARYFSVGKITEEQLADYASRRGLPIGEMRKFLAANLE